MLLSTSTATDDPLIQPVKPPPQPPSEVSDAPSFSYTIEGENPYLLIDPMEHAEDVRIALPGEFFLSASTGSQGIPPLAALISAMATLNSAIQPLAPTEPSFSVVCSSDPDQDDPALARVLYSTAAIKFADTDLPIDFTSPDELPNQAELDAELTPQGIKKLPFVPMASEVSIQGILDSEQNWMTFRMPVGPHTQSLNVSMKAGHSASTKAIPAIDDLYLVSRTGAILAMVRGAAGEWPGLRQELMITLNGVPVGAQLLVRVVQTPLLDPPVSENSPVDGAAGQAPGEGAMPFVMDITRVESPETTSQPDTSVTPPSSSSDWLSSLSPTPIFGPAYQPAPSSTAPPATSTADRSPGSAPSTNQVKVSADPAVKASTEETPSVTVGPMATVGSAPMGPRLGADSPESTLLVDRNERAFDLALEGTSAGIDPELLPGAIARFGRQAAGASDGASASETSGTPLLVVLPGAGGFPMLAAGPTMPRGLIDPNAILATLSPRGHESDSEEMADLPELQPAESGETRTPKGRRSRHLDYLTAACGLVLGISLTSSPLYPDLMSLIRRKTRLRYRLVGRGSRKSLRGC